MWKTRLLMRFMVSLPIVFAGVFGTPARADMIDHVLLREAPAIMKAVQGLGHESVAVLKFEVQIGNQQPTFEAGLANTKLAQKLENLLVIANDSNDPLFVLTGASDKTSDFPPNTTWRSAEGRRLLAKIKDLPLAWDSQQKLSPEVFIAGRYQVDSTFKSGTLELLAFTRNKPDELLSIYRSPELQANQKQPVLPTDRSILNLLGVSYALSTTNADRAANDRTALEQATSWVSHKSSYADTMKVSPVQLEIYLNDKQVTPIADPKFPGAGRIANDPTSDPKRGDKFTLRIINQDMKKSYGVLLAVNGRNTNALDRNHDLNSVEPKDHRLWILGPGESATIPGFYKDIQGNYEEFRILGDSESQEAYNTMGSQYRGLITMHVFQDMPVAPPEAPKPVKPMLPKSSTSVQEAPSEVELSLLSLGIGGDVLAEIRTAGKLDEAQSKLKDLTNVAENAQGQFFTDPNKLTMDRGLIVGSTTGKTQGPLSEVRFRRDPNSIAFMQIRYYLDR